MIQRIRERLVQWLLSRRQGAREIDFCHLLKRSPVDLDTPELQRFLAGKVALVSGAGGSIGSEICRQSMKFCPLRLILLDRAEHALFEIDAELKHRWRGAEIVPLLADICDSQRINQLFESFRPEVIFHAAAHKHVPMMEANPGEAIKNNIFGTKIVADAARASEAQAFVMVSTDKAVNPTSVMGATKRVAELYVQSLNGSDKGTKGRRDKGGIHSVPLSLCPSVPSGPRFVTVRFGNVLGSSGSVVPIFQKQIDAGGPVTVTHPEMERYFMTIPEASQLVMQAGAIGGGGEIFVLDMGEPVRILDLAFEMIRRRGLVPGKDIDIEFTGIRPGEKLYEELAADGEQTLATSHEKIRVWQLPRASARQIRSMLDHLVNASAGSAEQIRKALCRCVPEYLPDTTGLPVTEDQATHLRLMVAKSNDAGQAKAA